MTRSASWFRILFGLAVLSVISVAPLQAQPLPSSLTLTFAQQSGTVSPTASIPILVTLSNASSQAFVVNNTPSTFGLNPSLIPTTGTYFDSASGLNVTASFASYTSIGFSHSFGCATTFTTSCITGPPYDFTFGPGLTTPFSLAGGASTTFLLGTFVPSAGPVAAGTYSFFYAAELLFINGLDSAGHTLRSNAITLGQTCPGQSAAACGSLGYFSRTVVAVPEPGQWVMLAAGLIGLSVVVSRRTRRRLDLRPR